MQILKYTFYLFCLAGIASFIACEPDEPITDPSAKLEFSRDTLTFDTVFTTIGSATRSFKIYNRHNRPITISSIILNGGESSQFRINVDGVPSPVVNDVTIAAEDSMYVFAEVTVDPNDLNSPYIIEDFITFETNGNTQTVYLDAWGQNAEYIGSKAGFSLLSCDFGTFTFDFEKPLVIYGWLIIDSCQLEITEGQQIYVHGGLVNPASPYNDGVILVFKDGKLKINGTRDNPVVIQGDRLEADFEDEVGQWGGIWLFNESTGNSIEHAEIKNSIIGIRVDSAADLTLQNSLIHNTSSSGLLGRHATIQAENCLFYSSDGGNNVQLEYGGNYDFRHCTMASFATIFGISHSSPVLRMSNAQCFDLLCSEFDAFPLNANFKNCIIYGTRLDEVQLFDRVEQDGFFNYNFENCLIKVEDPEGIKAEIEANCTNCVINQDPVFAEVEEQNYRLDSLTAADGAGIPINSIITGLPLNIDLDGMPRDATNPDLGVYEYEE